jgi:sulfate transport system permease protein
VVDVIVPNPEDDAAATGPDRRERRRRARRGGRSSRWTLRTIAIVYVGLLLGYPVGLLIWHTFSKGLGPVWSTISAPSAVNAFELTGVLAAWTLVLNTLFGVTLSILMVRHTFPGKRLLNAFIDLPFAVSPVVVGLSLRLVYGKTSGFGGWLEARGIQIIFSTPGMAMATLFVTLPLIARELIPVLEEIGDDQEKAAWTLGASRFQTFWRITLPGIRWALAYGVVLTLARALGEYGAVAVVSGRILDQTLTATLYVDNLFDNFNQQGAYTVAMVLAVTAILALLLLNFLRPKERT